MLIGEKLYEFIKNVQNLLEKFKFIDMTIAILLVLLILIIVLLNKKIRKLVFKNLINLTKIVWSVFIKLFFDNSKWAFFFFFLLGINTYFLYATFQSAKDLILFPIIYIWRLSNYFYKYAGKYENKSAKQFAKELFLSNLEITVAYILIFNKLPVIFIELLKHNLPDLLDKLVSYRDLRLLLILIAINLIFSYIMKILIVDKQDFIQCEHNYIKISNIYENLMGIKDNKKLHYKLHRINGNCRISGIDAFTKSKIMFLLAKFADIKMDRISEFLKILSTLAVKLYKYNYDNNMLNEFIRDLLYISKNKENLNKTVKIIVKSDLNVVAEFNMGRDLIFDHIYLKTEEEKFDVIYKIFNKLALNRSIEQVLLELDMINKFSFTEKRNLFISLRNFTIDFINILDKYLISSFNPNQEISQYIDQNKQKFEEVAREKIVEFNQLIKLVDKLIIFTENTLFMINNNRNDKYIKNFQIVDLSEIIDKINDELNRVNDLLKI